MRTLKEILMEAISKKEESIKSAVDEVDNLFSKDSKYKSLKKKASTNDDDLIDFIEYISTKEKDLEKIAKKFKVSIEDITNNLV